MFKKLEEDVSPTASATAGGLLGTYVGGPVGTLVGAGIGGLISPVASLIRSVQKFTSPNTEEFEKLSNSFITSAKNIFGSRITDNDLKFFMSMVPTLSQTDNGKIAIINNMKSFNKAAQVKYKTMKKIIRDNGGRIPDNLQFLVEEEASPELNKISNEFISG